MNMDDTAKSRMLFLPFPKKQRRMQLRVSERRLLLMLGDFFAVVLSIFIALRIWAFVAQYAFDLVFITSQFAWFLVLPILWLVLASANDFYDLNTAANRWQSIQRLVQVTLQMLVVYVVVFFLAERTALPRLFIIYYGVATFILIAIWRLLNPALFGWASSPRRALIIGTDWAAETIIEILKRDAAQSYEIIGVIGSPAEIGSKVKGVPVIGEGGDLINYVRRDGVRDLIVTSTRELPGDVFQGVMDAYELGASITPMPLLYERITERVPVEHVGENWAVVLPIAGTSVFNPFPFLKRLLDLVLSIFGFVLFIVLLPFLALAIYIDSPGSIFYTQERVGLNGRRFRIIKLRTMIPNAEKYTGAVFAQQGDPRITRVGRLMRKMRLDELPQFVNILRGDMSLVGPRPERPEHVERLQQSIPFYRTRHTVRPGVTGWAQVRYKYGATDEDAMMKLQYDLYYIRHQSVLLDIDILIRTVGKVLQMGGQ